RTSTDGSSRSRPDPPRGFRADTRPVRLDRGKTAAGSARSLRRCDKEDRAAAPALQLAAANDCRFEAPFRQRPAPLAGAVRLSTRRVARRSLSCSKSSPNRELRTVLVALREQDPTARWSDCG